MNNGLNKRIVKKVKQSVSMYLFWFFKNGFPSSWLECDGTVLFSELCDKMYYNQDDDIHFSIDVESPYFDIVCKHFNIVYDKKLKIGKTFA